MLQIVGQLNSAQTVLMFEALAVSLPFTSPNLRLRPHDGLGPFHSSFVLKGFISYGGGHYVTYFRHKRDGLWYLYDDSSVRQAGSLFDVVSNTLRCRGLPVLVIFESSSMPVEQFSCRDLEILRNEAQRLDKSAAYHAEQSKIQDFSIFTTPRPSVPPKQAVELIKFIPVQYSPPEPFGPLQSEEAPLVAVEPERSSFQRKNEAPPKSDSTADQANSMYKRPSTVLAGIWRCNVCLTKYTKETLTCSNHSCNLRL
jgi:hypothetical protein